jgi:hypothetical protein
MIERVLGELLALPAERSRGRHNPRVVKRKMSSFPTKARAAPATGPRPSLCSTEIWIVAPLTLPAHTTKLNDTIEPIGEPQPVPPLAHRRFSLDHLRAWRASGLTRAAWCEQNQLNPRTFNTWIARTRHLFRRKAKRPA